MFCSAFLLVCDATLCTPKESRLERDPSARLSLSIPASILLLFTYNHYPLYFVAMPSAVALLIGLTPPRNTIEHYFLLSSAKQAPKLRAPPPNTNKHALGKLRA